MGRADTVVDVHAVGVGADQGDAGTGVDEDLGRDGRGRTVGAVEHHVDAVEPRRERAEQVHDVAVLGVGEARDPPDVATGRGGRRVVVHGRFDAVLDLVRQLAAAGGEELDPVVGGRVVRRGDHHAEVGVDVRDEERGSGGGDDPGVEHVDAGGGEPGGDGRAEELTGDARVARQDRAGARSTGRPTGVRMVSVCEHGRAGLGETQSQRGRQLAVGETTNTVGTEQTRHCDRVR